MSAADARRVLRACAPIRFAVARASAHPKSSGCASGSTLAEQSIQRERAKRETVDQALEEERRARPAAPRRARTRPSRARAGGCRAARAGRGQPPPWTRCAASAREPTGAWRPRSANSARSAAGAESLRRQLADAEAAVKRLTRAGEDTASDPRAEMSADAAHLARAGAGQSASGAPAVVRAPSGVRSAARSERTCRTPSPGAPPRSERPAEPVAALRQLARPRAWPWS